MARRANIKATHEFVVAADKIETRLMELVEGMCDERDELRTEVQYLNSVIGVIPGEKEIKDTVRSENDDEVSSESPVIEKILDEQCKGGAIVDDFVDKKAKADLKKLLASMYPVRLSDSELLRLAILSKLRSEIDLRQSEEEGMYNFDY